MIGIRLGWSERGDDTGLPVEHQRSAIEIDPHTTGHGVLVAAWRTQHAVAPAELGKPLPDAPGNFVDPTVGSLEQITVDESGLLCAVGGEHQLRGGRPQPPLRSTGIDPVPGQHTAVDQIQQFARQRRQRRHIGISIGIGHRRRVRAARRSNDQNLWIPGGRAFPEDDLQGT